MPARKRWDLGRWALEGLILAAMVACWFLPLPGWAWLPAELFLSLAFMQVHGQIEWKREELPASILLLSLLLFMVIAVFFHPLGIFLAAIVGFASLIMVLLSKPK